MKAQTPAATLTLAFRLFYDRELSQFRGCVVEVSDSAAEDPAAARRSFNFETTVPAVARTECLKRLGLDSDAPHNFSFDTRAGTALKAAGLL